MFQTQHKIPGLSPSVLLFYINMVVVEEEMTEILEFMIAGGVAMTSHQIPDKYRYVCMFSTLRRQFVSGCE